MKQFLSAQQSLGSLDADAAARLIAAAADIALIVDRTGVIRDVARGSEELSGAGSESWLGRAWADTVTPESRAKVEAILGDAAAGASTRWRHVNHLAPQGGDVPVLYSGVQVGHEGHIVAVGRSLRALSELQQRVLDAQRAMERDYARLRHMELRYRLLFQTTAEAVLVVDAANLKVVEANPAAIELLAGTGKHLVGRPFPEGFDEAGISAIQTLLAAVRVAGRSDDARARLAGGKRDLFVSASLFRQDAAAYFLVRIQHDAAEGEGRPLPKARQALLKLVDAAPDAIVVTDDAGRIASANPAFLDLCQLAKEDQARGEPLDRWLGRPGVDFEVLAVNLRQHGVVRSFGTTVRGEYGSSTEVEVVGTTVSDGDKRWFGFLVRNVGRRAAPEARATGRELPRSVEQLTELIGRVPLKDLVRETTDVIERLCIEAALELTGDNRASAAEMLGLSRQSLYVKLRRYGLGDLASDGDDDTVG